MPNSVEKACKGKLAFKDRATAKRFAKKVKREHNNLAKPYPCSYCTCWHLFTTKRKHHGPRTVQ